MSASLAEWPALGGSEGESSSAWSNATAPRALALHIHALLPLSAGGALEARHGGGAEAGPGSVALAQAAAEDAGAGAATAAVSVDRAGASGDGAALRCVEASHAADCMRCRPAPSAEEEDAFSLHTGGKGTSWAVAPGAKSPRAVI
jgi:hypothetical protein